MHHEELPKLSIYFRKKEEWKISKERGVQKYSQIRREELLENCNKSAPKIRNEIESGTEKICKPLTISHVFYAAGYHGRNIRNKPFVNKTNSTKRLGFVKENETKEQSFRNSVIFSDVWRKVNAELEPKNTVATVRHDGGSVMVWGCMEASGVGNLVGLKGRLTKIFL